MFYYIIIKNINDDNKIVFEIENTLNNYYGKVNNKIILDNKTVVFCIQGLDNKEYLHEYFTTLFSDHITKALVFISSDDIDPKNQMGEIEIVSKYMSYIMDETKLFVLKMSDLITLNFKNRLSSDLKNIIFKQMFNDQLMKDTLEVFFDNDLNSLKTSKILNIHRNTLNYRLNTFFEKTGLDPRKFNDAVIIKLML